LKNRTTNPIPLLILTLLMSWGSAAVAHSQPSSAARGEGLRVYVMTMGPGEFVWERFGHNAIRIRDEIAGTDVAYNYGRFSFEQEDFVLRFIRGQMDYWMEGFDTGWTVNAYAAAGRDIWMQELNLTPDQRADLRDFLEWNALPENRFYRYDYYFDNCSTRVRDAIDRVLGGQIREQTAGVGSGTTLRDHTRRLTADDPLVYAGLMAGLGQPVDREISVWEEMFLPMRLRDHFSALQIETATGDRVPLVLSEEQVFASGQPLDPGPAPSRLPAFLLGGLLVGGVSWAAALGIGRRRGARGVFTLVGTTWSVVAGTLGVVLLGLWLFTDHQTSYRNENLFFLSPLLVPLIGLVPAAAGRGVRARPLAFRVAVVVVVLSVVGFLVQALPGFYQANGEIIALALPANLGLALGLRELLRRSLPTTGNGAAASLRAAA